MTNERRNVNPLLVGGATKEAMKKFLVVLSLLQTCVMVVETGFLTAARRSASATPKVIAGQPISRGNAVPMLSLAQRTQKESGRHWGSYAKEAGPMVFFSPELGGRALFLAMDRLPTAELAKIHWFATDFVGSAMTKAKATLLWEAFAKAMKIPKVVQPTILLKAPRFVEGVPDAYRKQGSDWLHIPGELSTSQWQKAFFS